MPDCEIHSNCDGASPNWHSIAYDWSCLWIVNENWEEERKGDLAKAPSKKDQRKKLPVSLYKEIHLKPKGSSEPVDSYGNQKDWKIEYKVHQPVICHFHSIYFHCL